MKVQLLIDTTSNQEVIVGLVTEQIKDICKEKLDYRRAQIVLPQIERLLQKHKLTLTDITDIEVNPGPGSFTGIRVGVTIANTLAFLLRVPLNNKPLGEFVEAVYL